MVHTGDGNGHSGGSISWEPESSPLIPDLETTSAESSGGTTGENVEAPTILSGMQDEGRPIGTFFISLKGFHPPRSADQAINGGGVVTQL
jgi:hypothetical protein